MDQKQWDRMDSYLNDALVGHDGALAAALEATAAAGMPPIAVAPNQGKLLYLLASMVSARRILEIGTLGGYSTIWMARALPPDGRLISLEYDPRHADVARANIERAGLSDRVEVIVGAALDILPTVGDKNDLPFDLVFIDADKVNTPGYFEWALKLTRPGGLIVVDNVVRGGAVADASSSDPDIRGIRTFFEMAKADARVDGTAIQTVGSKGWDGLAILRVS